MLRGIRGLYSLLSGVGDLFGGSSEADTSWTLGGHKSPTTWQNQMQNRGWTNEDITASMQFSATYCRRCDKVAHLNRLWGHMTLRNTTDSFGWLAKAFHWLLALLIIGLWTVGSLMTDMENSPDKFTVYGLHKSTGIVVLALAVLAFTWRATNAKPGLPAHVADWQKSAATLVKYLLYVCMVAMPLSGWAMSSAAGYPVGVYGLFTLPPLVEKDDVMRIVYGDMHALLGNGLLVLFLLHAGAALKHHFFHKDGVLKRMLP